MDLGDGPVDTPARAHLSPVQNELLLHGGQRFVFCFSVISVNTEITDISDDVKPSATRLRHGNGWAFRAQRNAKPLVNNDRRTHADPRTTDRTFRFTRAPGSSYRADAGKARRRASAGRRLTLRAEVGRLPRDRVSQRRGRLHPEPGPASAGSLLPRAARGAARRGCRRAASSTARSSLPGRSGLDFDALQLRLHPAASRVAKLAKETPAAFVALRSACGRRRRFARGAAARAARAAGSAARRTRSRLST